MDVSSVMRTNVLSINPDRELSHIEEMMREFKTDHVLVLEDGELVGLVSDRDIKRNKSPRAGTTTATTADNLTLKLKAHQIMGRNPVTIPEKTSVGDAIELLLSKRIHSLPVVNDKGKVVGLITSTVLLRFLHKVVSLFE